MHGLLRKGAIMLKNCFNYVGSKDRIYPFIHKNLDHSKENLFDVFCGSGVVGINEIKYYDAVILNDACWQLTRTLEYFRLNQCSEVLREIDECIEKFELSKTNKEGYDKLRDFYNFNCNLEGNFNPIYFYCLVTHSFNYNIHINSSGGFSVPFGANRSYFNSSLRKKFIDFQSYMHENKSKVFIRNYNFYEVISDARRYELMGNTVFYCDPPYLSSDSAYGRIQYLGKWDALKEHRLYESLDFIHSNGGSFLLSNVVENNGKINEELKEWSKKYNVIQVPSDFTNCNYQRKNAGKTVEVLIRNY